MSFQSVARVALSGLEVESTRLAVSAGNVANQNTPGYRARRVTSENLPHGGAAAIVSWSSAIGPVEPGTEVPSNSDLTTDLVEQRVARRGYEANLAVLKAARDTEKTLLSVFA